MMVAIGRIPNDYSGIEAVDFETSRVTKCPAVPSLPVSVRGGAGGLINNQTPLVCSGIPKYNKCYLFQGGTWNQTGSFNTGRAHFVGLPNSPFGDPLHLFLILGGDLALTIEVFDGSSWKVVGPIAPTDFYVSCAVYINSSTILVTGGTQGSVPYSSRTFYMNAILGRWIQGPSLISGRFGHGCERILRSSKAQEFSSIVVGGTNGILLSSVEILDDHSSFWRSGPSLPTGTYSAPLVSDPRGGVIYIGGDIGVLTPNIYRLRNLDLGSTWELLPHKLTTPRQWHTAFLMPDDLFQCTFV